MFISGPVLQRAVASRPARRCEPRKAHTNKLHDVKVDNQNNAPCSTSRDAEQKMISRRTHLSKFALGFGGMQLLQSPAAQAMKLVTLRDGTEVNVFEHGMSLSIVALRGAVPGQWVLDFRSTLGKYAGFSLDQRPLLEDIYNDLSNTTKKSAGVADVASLGDAWLGPAIRHGLVQPISHAEYYRWYKQMPARWRTLVRRNPAGLIDPAGAVYGAPFRWGCTLVAYRRDKLLSWGAREILDWSDLLQPELKGRIAFLDSPRELVGVALKTLGLGYNTSPAQLLTAGLTAEDVKARVSLLKSQVKLFSNRDHVRAMNAGDVAVVVGWSNDLVLLAERSNSTDLVAPSSGTALWADVWTVPRNAAGGSMGKGPSPILPAWLEFSLSPARATAFPGLKYGASPSLLVSGGHGPTDSHSSHTRDELALNNANSYLPPRDVLDRSEFLFPMDEATTKMYYDILTQT